MQTAAQNTGKRAACSSRPHSSKRLKTEAEQFKASVRNMAYVMRALECAPAASDDDDWWLLNERITRSSRASCAVRDESCLLDFADQVFDTEVDLTAALAMDSERMAR
jgi:hypothetical protein